MSAGRIFDAGERRAIVLVSGSMAVNGGGRGVGFYSEWEDFGGQVRGHYAGVGDAMSGLGVAGLAGRWGLGRRRVDRDAVTFYLDPGNYRVMPVDFLPRVIPPEHWETIAAGVSQRIRAINRFLVDLYGGGQDVVPDEVMYTSQYFYPEVQGFRPPGDVFVQVMGVVLH